MRKEKKGYYAIIPASVRYDKTISPNAKLLYGEVTALCNEKGFCWATNQYFASLYEVSKRTIIRWLDELLNAGYLVRNIQYEEDGKTVIQRCISLPRSSDCGVINVTSSDKSVTTSSDKSVTTPSDKSVTYNNTSINNTKRINIHTHARTHEDNIFSQKEYLSGVLELCKKHCGILYNRHLKKPNGDYDLGICLAEVMEQYTLDDLANIFRHAAKTYIVKPRMTSCDLVWLMNNLEKVKNTPQETVSGGGVGHTGSPVTTKTADEITAGLTTIALEDIV